MAKIRKELQRNFYDFSLICMALIWNLLHVGEYIHWRSFQHLNCTSKGLTANKVKERLDFFGYNKLEEEKVSKAMFSFHLPCPYFLFFLYCLFSLTHWLVLLLLYLALGKQSTKVFRLYVESFILGNGSCSYHGNCSCTWRVKSIWLQIFSLFTHPL